MQINAFPKNILAVLDALAELGKATKGKVQILPPAKIHTVNEKTKEPKPKKVKNTTRKIRL